MRTNGFDPTEEQVLRYETETDRIKDAIASIWDIAGNRSAAFMRQTPFDRRDNIFYKQLKELSPDKATDTTLFAIRIGIDTVHANVHALAHLLSKKGLVEHSEFVDELIHQMGQFADDWEERLRQIQQEGQDERTDQENAGRNG